MIKEYYDILSLKCDASTVQIAEQYKRLVLRWHPRFAKQEQTTAHHHFSQISEAYQVLSDPLKRAFYDKYGYLKLNQGLFSEGELKGGYRFADNPDEIFEKFYQEYNPLAQSVDATIIERGSLFGHAYGGLNYKQTHKQQDLTIPVHCSLNELYLGVAKRITYERRVLNLDGRTTSLKREQRLLQIKSGYSEETHLVFRGEGHESVSRKASDLIFKIIEDRHSNYVRKGVDLIYLMDISLSQALNCQNIQINTLDNRILHIPIDEIINPTTIKVVPNEGIKDEKGSRGSLYVKFNLLFPKQLTEESKNELRALLS